MQKFNHKEIKYCVKNTLSSQEIIDLAEVMASEEPERFDEFIDWIKNEFNKLNPNTKQYTFAILENKIIGFVRIWNSPFIHRFINDGIVIKRKYQNLGIGKKLLEEGLKTAKNMGAKKVIAHIHKDNLSSIKIHEFNNFIKKEAAKIDSYGNTKKLGSYEYVCEF